MMNSAMARCCAALMPLLLMACAAANSIHYSFPGVKGSRVITVDAKQRHLIMTRDKADNIRACAEPAPDVFSALSSSFSGGALFGPTNREVEAAHSLAETAATIERTQTINLLREMMYRTCERYLSGALEKTQFLTLAARDHRSLVAFLAIEQLTGVVKPPATVISGPAARAARQQSKELIELMRAYETERGAAQTALDAAKTELATADTEVTVGDKKVKVCGLDTPPSDPAANAAYLVCVGKKQKVKDAEERLKAARANQEALRPSLDELNSALSAATEAGTSNLGGYDNPAKPTANDLIDIGKIVERITVGAGIDEALMFCIGYLAEAKNVGTTRETCNQIVANSAKIDSATKIELQTYTSQAAREISGSLTPDTTLLGRQRDVNAAVAARVEMTAPADLQARLRQFETTAKSSLGLAEYCKALSPEECAAAIRSFELAMIADLNAKRELVDQALADWN